jgi:hypothetical protein
MREQQVVWLLLAPAHHRACRASARAMVGTLELGSSVTYPGAASRSRRGAKAIQEKRNEMGPICDDSAIVPLRAGVPRTGPIPSLEASLRSENRARKRHSQIFFCSDFWNVGIRLQLLERGQVAPRMSETPAWLGWGSAGVGRASLTAGGHALSDRRVQVTAPRRPGYRVVAESGRGDRTSASDHRRSWSPPAAAV